MDRLKSTQKRAESQLHESNLRVREHVYHSALTHVYDLLRSNAKKEKKAKSKLEKKLKDADKKENAKDKKAIKSAKKEIKKAEANSGSKAPVEKPKQESS